MTTITIDRAVVEQALEFIRTMNSHGWLLADYESDMERTVAGLEAALAEQLLTEAQQEMERSIESLKAALAQEQAEPVATITECEACFTPDVCQLRGTCDHYAASQLRVATQPKRTAEPVQEPITRLFGTLPVHDALPKLVPLTDEEIALIDWESLKTKLDCVRAVERALEEKNRGR